MTHLELEVLASPDACVARLTLRLGDGVHYAAVGDAKLHPKDRSDPEIGRAVAIARALTELAGYVSARAEDLVEANCGRRQLTGLLEALEDRMRPQPVPYVAQVRTGAS